MIIITIKIVNSFKNNQRMKVNNNNAQYTQSKFIRKVKKFEVSFATRTGSREMAKEDLKLQLEILSTVDPSTARLGKSSNIFEEGKF